MSDYFYLRGRPIPREVAERALDLFDREVGLEDAIAEATDPAAKQPEPDGDAKEALPRTQPPITLEQIGQPYISEELIAERRAAALVQSQALVAKYVASDRSLVDELMAERRAEAERE